MAASADTKRALPLPDGPIVVLTLLIAIAVLSVVVPAISVLVNAIAGLRSQANAIQGETPGLSFFPWRLIGSTLLWTSAISVLSTVLAWPVAWALRTARRSAWAWLLAPMLAPSYLAYAGWGLLRAPRTWLGDLLERAAQDGHRWAPVLAGQALAVLGLALWAVPLAALVLWSGLRRIDQSVLDSLRLEPGHRAHRAANILQMSWRPAGVAIGLVMLLMMGSAVPLHLAQIPTYAIQVWLALDLTPAAQQWKVWILAWPLVLGALLAGWVIGGRLTAPDAGAVEGGNPRRSRPALIAGVAVWGAGVLIPLWLFVHCLSDPRSLARFWQLSGAAAALSGRVALAVGAIGVFIALGVALGLAGESRGARAGLTRACVRMLLIAGLMPGVLVGSAVSGASQLVARALPRLAEIGDSPLILVVAHVARFGFVPALVGCWLARTEGSAQVWLRRLDGADSLRGWAGATLPVQAGACISAGLAAAALSLHEIEAAVIVSPPGDSLPRQVLGYLHYLRTEEMCAAAVWIIGFGLVAGALGALLVGLTERSRRVPETGLSTSPTTPGGPSGI